MAAARSCSRLLIWGNPENYIMLKSCQRLAKAVGAQRLDVVPAVVRRSVRNRTAAEAAAFFGKRSVLALLKPVAQVGEHAADVLDPVNVERGNHHGNAAAGHDGLSYIFGGKGD